MNVRGNSKKIIAGALFAISMFSVSTGLTGCLTGDDGDKGRDTTKVTEKSVNAGAQDATVGSSVDIDVMTAYLIAAAKPIAADIDLIFAYSTSILPSGSAAVYSPAAAKAGVGGSAGFDFLKDFTPANSTEIKAVTTTFANITTKGQVDSLWGTGQAVSNGRLTVATGTTFLAKSNKGLIVLMEISSVVQSATGTATIKGKSKF